ncbi:MAG: hypothetical protein MUE66_04430, partial [Acidimicrobiia bacterium]|nr:hypothetical protein [Acidimicrobiia bacterium]
MLVVIVAAVVVAVALAVALFLLWRRRRPRATDVRRDAPTIAAAPAAAGGLEAGLARTRRA